MQAFKFLHSPDIGKVRDGTLYLSSADKVRKDESNGAGYGDPKELCNQWIPPTGEFWLHPDHPFIKNSNLTLKGPVRIINQGGGGFVVQRHSLMFCASLDRSTETIRRMKEEFGYDASFAIKDFAALSRAISRNFPRETYDVGEVVYEDVDPTSEKVLERTPFSKPTSFSWQNEIRFLCSDQGQARAVPVPGLWRFIDAWRAH